MLALGLGRILTRITPKVSIVLIHYNNPPKRVVGNFDPQKAGNLEPPETGLCSELWRYSAKMAISVTHEERANPGFYEERQAGTLFFFLFKRIAELPNRQC